MELETECKNAAMSRKDMLKTNREFLPATFWRTLHQNSLICLWGLYFQISTNISFENLPKNHPIVDFTHWAVQQ